MPEKVKMFTLSTCSHCKATKKFMTDHHIDFDFIDVDLLTGKEREEIIAEVMKYNPNRTFPTILIGNQVIVGFQEKLIKEALGIK